MIHQISLNNEEYAILAAEAAKSGLDPEQFLHKMIYKIPHAAQRKRPSTVKELIEQQYLEGEITHIPTKQPLTQEEREARERRAQRFGGGKSASEMVIEDRGAY